MAPFRSGIDRQVAAESFEQPNSPDFPSVCFVRRIIDKKNLKRNSLFCRHNAELGMAFLIWWHIFYIVEVSLVFRDWKVCRMGYLRGGVLYENILRGVFVEMETVVEWKEGNCDTRSRIWGNGLLSKCSSFPEVSETGSGRI